MARCGTDRSLAYRDGFFRKNSACLIKSRYTATGQLYRRKTMTQLDARRFVGLAPLTLVVGPLVQTLAK